MRIIDIERWFWKSYFWEFLILHSHCILQPKSSKDVKSRSPILLFFTQSHNLALRPHKKGVWEIKNFASSLNLAVNHKRYFGRVFFGKNSTFSWLCFTVLQKCVHAKALPYRGRPPLHPLSSHSISKSVRKIPFSKEEILEELTYPCQFKYF